MGKRDISRSLYTSINDKNEKKGRSKGIDPRGCISICFFFYLLCLSVCVCVPVPVPSLPSSFFIDQWHRSPLIRNIVEFVSLSTSEKVWGELSFFWLTLSHFVLHFLFSFLILPTIITSLAPSHPHFPLLLLEHSHPRTLTSFGQPHTPHAIPYIPFLTLPTDHTHGPTHQSPVN